MGENASATEGSTSSESDAKSPDTKTKSDSTTTVQRTPDVPAAKGHGAETGPEALGIDRMADQQRKRRERNLGPATVRRLEEQGEIDREPSDFQREAADLASRIADDQGPEVDRSTEESGRETTPVQRSAEGESASGGGEGGGGASSLVQNVVSSSGGSLDPGVRGEMESKMGTDFSDVRVHTGPEAGKAAQAINAKAFTVGNHVAFNHGAYDTSSPEGKHTIAHELAHVEQQANQAQRMAQRVQEGSGLEVSDPKDPHEQEAERVAREVIYGSDDPAVHRLKPTPSIQRTQSPVAQAADDPNRISSPGGSSGQPSRIGEEEYQEMQEQRQPEETNSGDSGPTLDDAMKKIQQNSQEIEGLKERVGSMGMDSDQIDELLSAIQGGGQGQDQRKGLWDQTVGRFTGGDQQQQQQQQDGEGGFKERVKTALNQINLENLAKGVGGGGAGLAIAALIGGASGGVLAVPALTGLMAPMAGEVMAGGATGKDSEGGGGQSEDMTKQLADQVANSENFQKQLANNEQLVQNVAGELEVRGSAESGSGGGSGLVPDSEGN